MRFDGILLLLALPWVTFPARALAQPVSVGIVGGISLTDDFQNLTFPGPTYSFLSYPTSKGYLVGPMVELRLPLHFSAEFDALYRPLHFTNAIRFPNGTLNSVSPATVVTWEFPLLAKYRFTLPVIKPLVEVGPSFRASGNLNNTSPSNHGITLGVGGETGWRKLKIAPVIRYTHWASDGIRAFNGRTNQNQVELLFALSF